MDRNPLGLALVVAIILGAPAVIIGLAVAAYPVLVVPALIVATVVWIGAIIVGWLLLQIRDLRTEVADLKGQKEQEAPAPPSPATDSRMWDEVETIDLFLEEGLWKPTNRHRFHESATLRVTVTGPKRFVVHLATDIVDSGPRKPKYASVERAAETKSLRRTFTIPKEGEYALVVEPSGASGFWVKVHVEVEYVPGVIGFDW